PGAAAEHPAAHDRCAGVPQRLLDDRGAGVYLSPLHAVGLAPGLQLDHPLVQILAAFSQRVLLALVGAGGEAVERDRDLEAEPRHSPRLPGWPSPNRRSR